SEGSDGAGEIIPHIDEDVGDVEVVGNIGGDLRDIRGVRVDFHEDFEDVSDIGEKAGAGEGCRHEHG
ncbi:hypothetical protein Dimus_005117, partial [Dionaea muscipula]